MYKIQDSLLETKLKKTKSDNLFLLAIAFLLSIMLTIMILSNHVFLNVQVLGPSMEPTLQSNDVLIANRIKKAQRFSIIIIKGEKEDWLIKRVIGVGGDTVKIEGGYVYVNGELIEEPYLKKQGFIKRGSTYYRIENDIAFCITLDFPSYVKTWCHILPLYMPTARR